VELSQEPINHASILVIDQDPVQWTIARSILEIMPLSLYYAASGEEAEVLSASVGFDLVLMDRHLGARDGDACAVRLRTRLCGVRYAAILACALDTEGAHAASVYDGLVIKPYSVLSLTKGVLLGLETMREARRQAGLTVSAADAGAAFC
jgi:CheY-like chemotaxis protein